MNISTPQASFLSNIGRFPSSYIGSANDGLGLGGIIPALVNIIVLGNAKMSYKPNHDSILTSSGFIATATATIQNLLIKF